MDKDNLCLILRPTKAEFSQNFTDFVRKVCAEHPGIPMFKVCSLQTAGRAFAQQHLTLVCFRWFHPMAGRHARSLFPGWIA